MNELERQRVSRIALDHAIRLQQEEPPPKVPHVCIRLAVASAAGAAALAAAAAQFLH